MAQVLNETLNAVEVLQKPSPVGLTGDKPISLHSLDRTPACLQKRALLNPIPVSQSLHRINQRFPYYSRLRAEALLRFLDSL